MKRSGPPLRNDDVNVRRSRGRFGRVLTRFRAFVGRMLHPKHALPCVGLVVLGGCLTLIMMPDQADTSKTPKVPDSSAGSHWLPRLEVLPMPTVVVDPGHGGKD